MKYRIGLDIGVASVGWAVLENDEHDEASKIVARGVRVFDIPQNQKDGGSLMAERRGFRSMRRTLRRRKVRVGLVKHLCESTFNIAFKGILEQQNLPCIYSIRLDALSRKLEIEEFARLMLHFIHRRGFLSNRKNIEKGSDDGKVLVGIKDNEKVLKEKGYKTIGEYYVKEFISKGLTVRNKSGSYNCTFNRKSIEDEIKLIFRIQRELGFDANLIGENFEIRFLELFNKQIPYDIGPGHPSPYAINSYLDAVGVCEFDGNPRAYQATNAAERFRLWSNLNNLVLVTRTEKTIKDRELTLPEKESIAEYCLHKGGKVTYGMLRKKLGLGEDVRFKHLTYVKRVKTEGRFQVQESEPVEVEKKVFVDLRGRSAVKKVFKDKFGELTDMEIDTIITVLHAYHSEDRLRMAIAGELENGRFTLDPEYTDYVLNIQLPQSKPTHLSTEIIYKILPHLEAGHKYYKAMELAGFNHTTASEVEKKIKLSLKDIEKEIRNPVVLRSVSQTIKVVNAIIDKYGSPQQVIVEVARDLARDFRERQKITRENEENQARNERIKKQIMELGILVPGGEDIVKYKLAQEQNWEDPYDGGRKIDAEKLFEPNYVQVDHIIPYSKSFDDSYANKVLVHAASNQNKGSRTPLQFLTGDRAQMFINWVRSAKISPRKRTNFLTVEPKEDEMKERNLKDTQYITKFIKNFLEKHLYLADSKHGVPIKAIKGGMTAHFRKRLGLNKFRDTDEHHATDAIVVACFTDKLVRQITEFSKRYETIYEKLKFPEPWDGFRDELQALAPVSVSRMPNRKITGPGHKETVRGLVKELDVKGREIYYTITRVPLAKLKLKNGEIEGYYNKESDIGLYNKIKDVLLTNPEKDLEAAFSGFRKPKADGTDGPVVHKVKIKAKTTNFVTLDRVGGVADNGSMVRIDIFAKGDKFYFVPIYTADFYKPQLPNKASVSGKPYVEWLEMDEGLGFEFKFSLYSNDIFHVAEYGFLYYRGADISSARISAAYQDGRVEDGKRIQIRMGIQKLQEFRKMEVSVLGEIKDAPFQPRDVRTLLGPRSKKKEK
ncbi:MAG: type II CRISPR RNA-guided endonuclease Cas9 [Firmicutes bacterium]|nr:type II CRISPR RNA-guided endonuclease Cas9 [Bacillota bacterium]